MNIEIPAKSKIWLYLCNKEITDSFKNELESDLKLFLNSWNAHGNDLKSFYNIAFGRILMIGVNEEEYGASGCSIDKQLHFVKAAEQKFGVSLLDRMMVGVLQDNDQVLVFHATKTEEMLATGKINENSLVFDNTITDGAQIKENWIKPLHRTWLSKYISKVK